jgi:glycosyltransferase involved in cell wall biosynthesis
MFQKNGNRYFVQSPSMAAIVRRCLGHDVEVSVIPFVSLADQFTSGKTSTSVQKFDFVYVASGEVHKNHGNLLEAWRLLADAGLKPSLALTVNTEAFPALARKIAKYEHDYGLDIENLGQVQSMDIPALYQFSSALIFPSQVESFGLPLIEATQLGLPVLASELDFVRDVIQPVETFDPKSPVSIARSVRRFMGKEEPVIHIRSAEEFLAKVLE